MQLQLLLDVMLHNMILGLPPFDRVMTVISALGGPTSMIEFEPGFLCAIIVTLNIYSTRGCRFVKVALVDTAFGISID